MPEYNKEYAEELPYFSTTVMPSISMGEIEALLEDFGVTNVITQKGTTNGKTAWLIRFQYIGQVYRFIFQPKKCLNPDKVMTYAGKRRTNAEQSVYQMGRCAVYFVKAMLMAADVDPNALFAFAELEDGKTVAQLGMNGAYTNARQLMSPKDTIIEGEIVDE